MATDTNLYKLNHTMMRIKDPKKTTDFYSHLGMTVINKLSFPDNNFDLIFLGYDSSKSPSNGNHWTDREGLIELTHNYGSEDDDSFKITTGNEEPHLGFRNISIAVDNLQAVRKGLEEAGYTFHEQTAGVEEPVPAAVLDPDGYAVQLVPQVSPDVTEGKSQTDKGSYLMNRTNLRVKDAQKSIAFYTDIMGMERKSIVKHPNANSESYVLGYTPLGSAKSGNVIESMEGLLELTWNYGTEDKEDFKYHNGNDEPQGFGHIAVAVDDLDAACSRFEEKKVNWKKRLTDGRMKNVAFILDPDGYWIEVIQNEKLKERSKW